MQFAFDLYRGDTSAVGESRDQARLDRRLSAFFEPVGLDYSRFSEELKDRFRLSLDVQHTLADDFQCATYADAIAGRQAAEGRARLSPEEWARVKRASLLTDIGKTGPAGADEAQRKAVARVYSIDTWVPGGVDAYTMERFLAISPALAAQMPSQLRALASLGISADANMRAFFNLHAEWTADLLRDEPAVDEETKVLAALHHLLEGVNPHGLVDLSDERGPWIPSLGRPVGIAEIWVILFDKYQAQRTRSRRGHGEAIGWLRGYVNGDKIRMNPFSSELRALFNACLDDMEVALADTAADAADVLPPAAK